jgi:AraC-like DNA-binding protein
MSKSAFYTAFTHEFGITPKQLIIRERVSYARDLLIHDGLNIKEASYASGFSDPNYFIRIFKKLEGMTPGELRKQVSI